jgi:membrane fusion protein (multidrug efflux system)
MYAYFSVAANELKDLVNTDTVLTKTADILAHMPAVELVMGDGSTFGTKGKVETMSAIVNPTTGALSLRAKFDNQDNTLRSGTFVNVRIPYVLKNVLSVPQSATYEQQGKKFVYVLQGDNTVKSTAVSYIEDNAGAVYYITGGVKAGDKVVVEGITRLRDGMPIIPVEK